MPIPPPRFPGSKLAMQPKVVSEVGYSGFAEASISEVIASNIITGNTIAKRFNDLLNFIKFLLFGVDA